MLLKDVSHRRAAGESSRPAKRGAGGAAPAGGTRSGRDSGAGQTKPSAGIENFWAMLKRGYDGTYHRMSAKHLPRYVAEFAGRHNNRRADTIARSATSCEAWTGSASGTGELVA